jgi:lysyl-tRNA synthetase class 2
MSIRELSEQEIIRRESLNKLRELGINPYPADEYPITNSCAELKENTILKRIIFRKFR